MERLLVTTQELADHLADPDWVVIDTRHDLDDPEWGRRVYERGHIPGAYFLDIEEELSGPKTGTNGRHPLPDPAAFAARLEACGIGPGSRVVAYDDAGGCYAVRLWWMLRWLGHERAALLDGGLARWEREARPVTAEQPPRRQGGFVPRPMLGATVDAAYVEHMRTDPSARLVDARAAERYTGAKEPLDPVPGHVPGAVQRFWKTNLAPDATFKSPEDLRDELLDLLDGTAPERSVHMCGSGVTACHNLFAMALAGLDGGRLYPGSWSEWCADPSRPVAKGPTP